MQRWATKKETTKTGCNANKPCVRFKSCRRCNSNWFGYVFFNSTRWTTYFTWEKGYQLYPEHWTLRRWRSQYKLFHRFSNVQNGVWTVRGNDLSKVLYLAKLYSPVKSIRLLKSSDCLFVLVANWWTLYSIHYTYINCRTQLEVLRYEQVITGKSVFLIPDQIASSNRWVSTGKWIRLSGNYDLMFHLGYIFPFVTALVTILFITGLVLYSTLIRSCKISLIFPKRSVKLRSFQDLCKISSRISHRFGKNFS